MIFEDPEALKARIIETTKRRVYGAVEVTDDTSRYLGLHGGMVLRLDGDDYYIIGDAREERFGIEEQPKYWVKYCVNLTTGERKILKLVFYERFTAQIGDFTVRCDRNPDKESRVLELVAGDRRYMQGRTVLDSQGNNVRILDWIRGDTLYNHIAKLYDEPHEVYYAERMPALLEGVAGCIEALAHLQDHDLHHGDVRNDHILIDSTDGAFRWIDFDLEVNYLDYDIWSVGNILAYVVGKGIRTCKEGRDIIAERGEGETISADDSLLFFGYRVANLRKLHPYISADLNELLMRFSRGTVDFYEGFAEIARDLREILDRKLL